MKTQRRRVVGTTALAAVIGLGALHSGGCAAATPPPPVRTPGSPAEPAVASEPAVPPEPQAVLGGAVSEVTLTPLQIRDRMRAFADYYRDKVAAVCDAVAQASADPARARRARQMKIDASTAMYDIAVDPAPTTAMINALVMVSLQTNTADRHAAGLFGEAGGAQVLAVAQEIQREAFGLAAQVMSEPQRQQLLDLVNGWTQQNPDALNIWYVRLNNLPGVQGKTTVLNMVDSLTDLPGKFLGKFIPGVTSAGESVSEATLLAERMSWLTPRLMILAQWRGEMLVSESLEAPQVADSLEVARRVVGVVESLPDTLDAQRDAIFNGLEQHDELVGGLLERTESIAHQATSLFEKIDTVVARVQTMFAAAAIANAGRPKSDVPARPFDITEYTAAIAGLDAAVQNASRLLEGVETATDRGRLAAKLGVVKADVSGLIWQAGGVLGGAAALAGLLIVLAVKLIPRRG